MARHGTDRWGRDMASGWPGDTGSGVLAPPPLMSSRELLRTPVVNRRGQRLGELQDLMFDAEAGTIAYAVVLVPTPAGPKRFAMPWTALQQDAGRARLVWDVERQALERSPGLPPAFTNEAGPAHGLGSRSDEPCERIDRL